MNKDELLKLYERVEVGDYATQHRGCTFTWNIVKALGLDDGGLAEPYPVLVARALNGSLDAAKALHDAVLPGWWFCFDGNCKGERGNNAIVAGHGLWKSCSGSASNPAAAWVAAILRAVAENRGG